MLSSALSRHLNLLSQLTSKLNLTARAYAEQHRWKTAFPHLCVHLGLSVLSCRKSRKQRSSGKTTVDHPLLSRDEQTMQQIRSVARLLVGDCDGCLTKYFAYRCSILHRLSRGLPTVEHLTRLAQFIEQIWPELKTLGPDPALAEEIPAAGSSGRDHKAPPPLLEAVKSRCLEAIRLLNQ